MNCQQVRERLSAYHDGELPADAHLVVAGHLADCHACAGVLADFARMTAMTGELDSPVPPSTLWNAIERQLDAEPARRQPHGQRLDWISLKPLAIAASLLLALGASWFAYKLWFAHGNEHKHFAAEFGEYLDILRRDPLAAEQFLLGRYGNWPVQPMEDAIERLGYRPAVADGLPEGYALESARIVKMPCCICVEALCQRDDGTSLVLFEHDDDDTEWFGDRPRISAQCNGQQCSLIELDDQITAIWERGARNITLVGVRDVTEVSRFVAWFDERRQLPEG